MNSILNNGGPVAWMIAISVVLLLTFALKLIIGFIAKRGLQFSLKIRGDWDHIFFACLDKTSSITLFTWLFQPFLLALSAPEIVTRISKGLLVVITCLQFIKWGVTAVAGWKKDYIGRQTDQSSLAAIGLLATALKSLVVIAAVLVALSNLGIDVGALVAGLGVGGIAVALAAQNVLGDLLASLSIVLDKPFVTGDYITVGNDAGTVENIGLKTTRVRSLSGEQLIFSNKDLLESRVRNFKRMYQRRVVHKLGVTYSASRDQLEQIPVWLKAIVEGRDKIKLDHVHLMGFGESSIDYELVYFVLDQDFALHADIQQKILLEIYSKFEKEGVDFAYPSRTIYIEQTEPRVSPHAENPQRRAEAYSQ